MPNRHISLRTWCATLALMLGLLLAAPVLAASPPAIEVSLTPLQTTFSRGHDVLVRISFTNRSATPVQLLRWRTNIEEAGSSLFEVRRDGQEVAYLGRQIKRAPPGPEDYQRLEAGASLSDTVELSTLYDMRVTGSYTVRYRSPAQPQDGAALQALHDQAVRDQALRDDAVRDELTSPTARIWVEGPLPQGSIASPVRPLAGSAGLSTTKCSNAQQEQLSNAYAAGRSMAHDSQQHLEPGTYGARYTTWFGAFDQTRHASVSKKVAAIRDAFDNQAVEIDCSCNASYFAYVYPAQPYKIYVCKAFWQAANTGTDSRGGTLLHELSHFHVVADTDDTVYGQIGAASLARSDPQRAINNADSYEYFGENSPPQQ